MSKKLPKVSDHAVIRYLERSQGVDIEGVRSEIAKKAKNGLEQDATAVIVDGLRYPIVDGVITTVLCQNRTANHIGKLRRKPELDA